MVSDLVEVHPRELKFTFELKKQSSCSIQLVNKSLHHVAFKVKTTSPRKYCVRPNVGIIKPNSAYDFTVIMQAYPVAPPDLVCRDKFLIQRILVPIGTKDEEITSSMFSKDAGKYMEESKLKVVLVNPKSSPVPAPKNGIVEQVLAQETSETKNQLLSKVELTTDDNDTKYVGKSTFAEDKGLKPSRDLEELKVIEDIETKLHEFKSKLSKAEAVISKLTEERKSNTQKVEISQLSLDVLRRKRGAREQVGFPFLFVCTVALISATLGYLLNA